MIESSFLQLSISFLSLLDAKNCKQTFENFNFNYKSNKIRETSDGAFSFLANVEIDDFNFIPDMDVWFGSLQYEEMGLCYLVFWYSQCNLQIDKKLLSLALKYTNDLCVTCQEVEIPND